MTHKQYGSRAISQELSETDYKARYERTLEQLLDLQQWIRAQSSHHSTIEGSTSPIDKRKSCGKVC